MGQLSDEQRKMGLVIVTLFDIIAVGIVIMTLFGWIDRSMMLPVLILVAGSGLLVGFMAVGRRRDAD